MLRAKKKFIVVLFPAVEKPLETIWREANGCCGCKVETAGIKQIEKGVLENLLTVSIGGLGLWRTGTNLSPDFEMIELGIRQSTNDGICNIPNTRLNGEKMLGQATMRYFVFQECD